MILNKKNISQKIWQLCISYTGLSNILIIKGVLQLAESNEGRHYLGDWEHTTILSYYSIGSNKHDAYTCHSGCHEAHTIQKTHIEIICRKNINY